MALYALDEETKIVFAPIADPNHSYRCVECRGAVARRSGLHKRAYFSHLKLTPHCRLHSKSSDHLVVQTTLKEKIPQLEIERPFPSVLRIGDLCWEEKKIVIEIQCSPIALREVEHRERDYSHEGYSLVWLLDDRLFNKKKVGSAEERLRKRACYFFSMRREIIYDQFELISEQIRHAKGPPLPVNLALPKAIQTNRVPLRQLKERKALYSFSGDLYDRANRSSAYLKHLIEYEQSISKP